MRHVDSLRQKIGTICDVTLSYSLLWGVNLRVKNYLEGFQELFQHFDARCLSVADSGPTQQYELQ